MPPLAPTAILSATDPTRLERAGVDRSTPSTRLAGLLLISLAILAAAGKPILYDTIDPDFFWHLRVAEQLRTDGIGPIVDRLSFSSIREPWTPYSWLAELAMERTWQVAGLPGILLAQATLVTLMIGFVSLASLEATRAASGESRYLPVGVATFAATFLSLPYLSFRPVLFALVLFALSIWLAWRDRRLDRPSRSACLLPAIVAVCVNLHLYTLVLATLLIAFVALDTRRSLPRRLSLCALIALACCCTPMLPGVIRTALYYQRNDPMVASGLIAEMQPFWSGTLGVASAVVASAMLARILRRARSLRVADWFALGVAVVLLLRLGRFTPIFAIVSAPLLAGSIVGLSDRVLGRPIVRVALATLLLLGVRHLATAIPAASSFERFLNRHVPEQDGYPTAAAEYVERKVTPVTGRLVNEFTWGGYLAWRLGDRFQTLLDGRTQLFPAEFWHAAYLGDQSARHGLLVRADADAAILPARRSHFRDTLLSLGWTVAHRDDIAEVLLPPTRTARLVKE